MDCWSLLIGARKLRAKGRRFTPADDRLIEEITTRHFPDGFTILNAMGSWFDSKQRRLIKEESRQILIGDARPSDVRRWGFELGRALGQEEIVVVHLGKALRLRTQRGVRRT
jgi:hypothetical protein